MKNLLQNQRNIAVLLSTYNGGRFIHEQLDSLIKQSYQDFTIFIRDDGSQDDTLSICRLYANRYPQKIILVDNEPINFGARGSFNYLTQAVLSNYYMYCDQDDYWLPNKIADTYEFYQQHPQERKNHPLLIYTDAQVVDSNLEPIAASLIRLQGKPPNLTFKNAIFNGVCLGCTTFFNRNLRNLAIPIPTTTVMHDSWLTKIALITGKVSYLDKATLLYRQHANNVFGIEHTIRLRKLPKTRNQLISSRGGQVYQETLTALQRFNDFGIAYELLSSLQQDNFWAKLIFLQNNGYFNSFLMKNYKSLLLHLWLNK